jgi:CO/xanthine dehydrogenase FAD-binding subunit
MEFLQPSKWREALEMRCAHPAARALWGGTDVMVELNFARDRPDALLDLTRIGELSRWSVEDGWLRIGAGVSYTRVIEELGDALPGLATASRTVGSPQIRNRGTIGGNLGSSSPAGDALPPLYAGGAEVELESVRGHRRLPVEEFIVGPKRNTLAEDELIAAVWMPAAGGPQQFAKVGTRNAMVIAVCSFALDVSGGRVGTCIGSAGPTPIRARKAEAFAEALGDELPDGAAEEFGALVAAAASPIDDVRGTAAYRRHALSVLAKRTLTWAWKERRACA